MTSTLQSIFRDKINGLITQIDEFESKNPTLWKQEYDFIRMDLEEVLSINEGNYQEAEDKYNKIIISKHESFDNYVRQENHTMENKLRGNNIRVKLSRAKRKFKKCPMCNSNLDARDATYVCKKCDYTTDIKPTKTKTNVRSNDNIYIHKQLANMTGLKKPPANISKIIPYISIWLTEMKYIHEWLTFKDKYTEGYYLDWKKKLVKTAGINRSIIVDTINDELSTAIIDDGRTVFTNNDGLTMFTGFSSIVIERTEDNMFNCEIFKVFTDELYKMLEYAKNCSKVDVSNMYSLDDKVIIEIFANYIKKFPGKVPGLDESFNDYEVGHYINELSLTIDKSFVKDELEKLFKCSLTIPGLMFNFKDVYAVNENVPQCYNYIQEFPYIIHETFKVPYATIPPRVKEQMVELISLFNNYHKNTNDGKSSNSPLLCCTLENILDFPYFNEYKSAIMKFLQRKDKNTISIIKARFFQFTNDNIEYLKQFQIIEDKPIEESKQLDDTINVNDFIF